MTEHEEARRLTEFHDLSMVIAGYNDPDDKLTIALGNFNRLLSERDKAHALLAKAEQERDAWKERYEMLVGEARKVNRAWRDERDRADAAERELERLRKAICAEAHHFPPDAVTGTSCYCGKATW